ncbi:MAG: beta-N-acetylglucosaminidase domain-containing protein, partial [Pseudomonadota bacterium]
MAPAEPRPRFDVDVGVIEGFFGKTWSWEERAAYAGFLRDLGFSFYIYTPKDDRFLRQRWRDPWPAETVAKTSALSRAYRDMGLSFGLGFSPFELHLDPQPEDAAALRAKVAQLNEADPDILCIQFDDMRGAAPDLADQQMATIDEICSASTASRFIACPTYYSFDPALERVFGAMPENYLTDLGRLLDPAIDVFWTGPEVCSRRYPA